MSHEQREQYRALDLLIVPSPVLNEQGDAFPNIDPTTGMYVGGHLRMSAAAEFSLQYQPRKIVVVGGLDPEHGARMTRAMKQFVVDRNSRADVQQINSLPCTRHNVIALFNQLARQLAGKRIAVLTNEYHLPRFLAFWSHLQKSYPFPINEPLPVPAESFSKSIETDINALDHRREAETRGLADLRAGKYVDRCLARLATFGHELAKFPERYLSPHEQKHRSPH